MQLLNLPSFEHKLRNAEGKLWIFDIIRKKYVVLTPEEWVRQHFINYMITELKYPRTLLRVEGGLTYNKLSKRSDIVVYDRDGKPWMVVECKAPGYDLSQATLHQATAYNAALRARFLVISNGFRHYCASTDWENGVTKVLPAMPAFET